MAYAPSLWAAGSMSMEIFTCLLDDIEPDQRPPWPSIVGETLHMLLDDEESLSASLEYREFLKGPSTEIVTFYGADIDSFCSI
jgi:hypothetical protein